MKKIGMCCACGDQMHKNKTVIHDGMELCKKCADMMKQEVRAEEQKKRQ